MSDIKELVTILFKSHNIVVPAHRKELFDKFLQDEQNTATINTIIQNQNQLMAKWKLEDRIADIIQQQVKSTELVLNGTSAKRIFVDGGFGKNNVYMHMLAESFPGMEIYAASVAQASALGAALAIHPHWNEQPFPSDIIELKLYSVKQNTTF